VRVICACACTKVHGCETFAHLNPAGALAAIRLVGQFHFRRISSADALPSYDDMPQVYEQPSAQQ
jgi:hypothetical protein